MSTSLLSDHEQSSLSPITTKDRIKFLDALRGFAVLGIFIMNIMEMGQPQSFYFNMDLSKPLTGANYYTWMFGSLLCEGVMRGIFSVLFGAGAILLLGRLESKKSQTGAADIYYRRMLWLVAFGLLDAFVFLWSGDILYFYGLMALFLYPFRNMSPRRLLIPILIVLAFGVYRESKPLIEKKETITKGRQAELMTVKHQKLSEEQTADLQKWHDLQKGADVQEGIKAAAQEQSQKQSANFSQLFSSATETNIWWESTFLYNNWWDMILLFFVGMAFIKSGFLTGKSSIATYVLVTIIGLGFGLGYKYWQLRELYQAKFDDNIVAEHMLPIAMNQIRRLLQVSGYISFLILLYKLAPFRRLFNILVPVGQMALTNYLSQSIIAAVFFYGMGYFGKFERYQLLEIVAVIYVFQIIFSNVWLKYFSFGPFEWLWRSLTYTKIQPLKKANRNVAITDISGV